MTDRPTRHFRSRDWFADPARSDMVALYLERFMNYGVTPEELRSGKPIIGIAQSGSDLSPCNRIHLDLAKRVRDGIRDAGGIPMEFPVHPIFENCRRPPPRSTAIWPIWVWSKSSTAIPSMPWC
jgi:dihydroxy-acid dehydratase